MISLCAPSRASRTPFDKSDQDQLAFFLATNIGARNGNAIYKEFALTHTNHTWQSWRCHYLHNDLLINTRVRSIQRALRQANQNQTPSAQKQKENSTKKKNEIDDHSSSSDSSKEIILISRRSPQSRKGKEKPIDYLSVEIDDDDHRSDLTESETDTHHPSTTDYNNLHKFSVHRIPFEDRNCTPKNSTHGYVTDQLSSNQLGKIQLLPTAQVVTMSIQDEKSFIRFMDKYPQGDLRLSTKLYEIYHLKAPQFTADEYRAYYLEYQNKHRKRPAPWGPQEILRKKINKQVQDQVSSSSRHTTVLEDQDVDDEEMISRRNEIDPELDALSVSDGSTDELDLDYILDTSNPDHIKNTHFFNDTSFGSLVNLQNNDNQARLLFPDLIITPTTLKDSEDQVDKDHSPSTTISGQEKVKEHPCSEGRHQTSPGLEELTVPGQQEIEPVDQESGQLNSSPALQEPTPQETRLLKSRSERRVQSETKIMTPTDSTGLMSGQISRRSSFKPARPPDSVDEALKLLEVFLEDFGDLYSGLEAAKLLHQCGDWSILFELATLKRIDQQLKQASSTTTTDVPGEAGTTVDLDEHEDEELDPDYFARIQKMVWSIEEDQLLLSNMNHSLDDDNNHSSMQSKIQKLIDQRGLQAVENRQVFLVPNPPT
ncbi:hypothetical protein PSTT_10027 [Puccinia striiformis]|uniref:DNA-binding protein RAP1 n=1 Tax=Puccinia striiformis TaxID=27350 RepID=A0A2S4V5X7_9BASI|nr:hypothetical protein PSTT_10027 [Puccinia striiformis]